MASGRPKNTIPSKPVSLKLNPATREYLEAIANAGTYGNNWTDVIYRFIGEGIERVLRDKVIPRRKPVVTYEVEGSEPSGSKEPRQDSDS